MKKRLILLLAIICLFSIQFISAQTWDITNFLIEKKNVDFDTGRFVGLLIDINNDNLEDMICTQQDFDNEEVMDWVVFENTGNGNFIPVNNLLENGTIQFQIARDYIVADFNNDNKEDVLFAGHGPDLAENRIKFGGGEQSQLWLQNGSGKLKNVTSFNLPQQKGLTHSIAAGDIDNDGDLDIFLGNSPIEEDAVGPRFHLNDGKGIFTDFPGHLPSDVENLEFNFLDWAFIDADKDGFLDLIGARGDNPDYTKDVLLLNDGNLNFNYSSANALPVRGGGLNWGTQEFIVSDFNGDGYSDIIASSYTQFNGVKDGQLCYWENKKDGTFSDVSTKIEKSQYLEEGEEWYTWFYPIDLNNDGWMDLCAVAGFMPPRIYINQGNGILKLVEDIPDNFSHVVDILPSDLGLDGDIDLIFLTGESDIYVAWNKNNFSVETPPLPLPEPPTPVSPILNEVVSKSPLFEWEPNGATVTVQIQVALDEEFTNLVYNNLNITAHNTFKIDLGEENNFFWRIRGTNTRGTGEWSDIKTFKSANIAPDSIGLSNNKIYGNVKYGTTVGILTASDEDSDTFFYSLVDGNGSNDIDNPSFFIVGDKLKTNDSFLMSKDEFFINIQVDDGGDGSYIQPFTINMLPSGFIACYPFNENANDKCGEGYNGTVNGPLLTTDRFDNENSAYNFDGINVSNIYLGKGLGLINNSDEFTICAWINPEELDVDGGGQLTILGERKEGDNYQFFVQGDILYFSYWANENVYWFWSVTTIQQNEWQFVAVTFNGSQLKLYINGELDFTGDTPGNMNNHNSSLFIGAYDGENGLFKGKIDDISIYNRSLTAEEIHEKQLQFSVSGLDHDQDGVLNDDDMCSNTPVGTSVDANGCILLDSNNFTIEIISETCPDKDNGQIIIEAQTSHSYIATIGGVDYDFTTNKTIDNLAPGDYEICIVITNQTSPYCYSVTIVEGTTVSGKSSTTKSKTTVDILEGTAPYDVYLNGTTILRTMSSTFDIDTKHGDLIEVKTDVACEGVYSKTVQLFNIMTVYPNPTQGLFELAIPLNLNEVGIELYNYNSQLISKRTYPVSYGKVQLDLINQAVGMYYIKVLSDTPVMLKIIKK